MASEIVITEKSKALFVSLVKDAGNWNGTPLFQGSKEEKGNLTHLKKLGLLTTTVDADAPDCSWICFTKEGADYAESLGLDVSSL